MSMHQNPFWYGENDCLPRGGCHEPDPDFGKQADEDGDVEEVVAAFAGKDLQAQRAKTLDHFKPMPSYTEHGTGAR